jgi:glycosyltransferase involved in cell wall biosynthesis
VSDPGPHAASDPGSHAARPRAAGDSGGYAVITPARNEAENLARLAACLQRQTVLARRWVIVDNGSTDDTPELARRLAAECPWITFLQIPGERSPVRGAPVVRAFHAGLEALEEPVGVVVKLDADVSFVDDFFAQVLAAFGTDPSLGITGGVCLEQDDRGAWVPDHVTRDHVRGATKAYRYACLKAVLPLEERMGWDGIDELKAQVRGWRTRTLPDLCFCHHRVIGTREPTWSKWAIQGDMAHFMGYRPYYVVARSLYRALQAPSAVAMLWGYAQAAVTRRPRCSDAAAIAQLRRQQSIRSLPARAREARGVGALTR